MNIINKSHSTLEADKYEKQRMVGETGNVGREVATLNRVVMGDLTEMVTLEPRLEGDERVSYEVIWRRHCYAKAMTS